MNIYNSFVLFCEVFTMQTLKYSQVQVDVQYITSVCWTSYCGLRSYSTNKELKMLLFSNSHVI